MGSPRTLSPHEYPIFERKATCRDAVWRNEHLMVERFCPERQWAVFFGYWVFFGERGWARRFGSEKPIASSEPGH